MLFFDSIGLGFFTVVGIQTGITLDLHPVGCIALGTITACFGGVIRDISLSNIPLTWKKISKNKIYQQLIPKHIKQNAIKKNIQMLYLCCTQVIKKGLTFL